jgi:ferritin-like metal-binding protein YciE
MGLFSKDIQTMDDLFLQGLQDVYYAENQIVKALPKMIEKATNRDLSKGLKDHLEETEKQIGRLDQVFKMLEQKPKGVTKAQGGEMSGNRRDHCGGRRVGR